MIEPPALVPLIVFPRFRRRYGPPDCGAGASSGGPRLASARRMLGRRSQRATFAPAAKASRPDTQPAGRLRSPGSPRRAISRGGRPAPLPRLCPRPAPSARAQPAATRARLISVPPASHTPSARPVAWSRPFRRQATRRSRTRLASAALAARRNRSRRPGRPGSCARAPAPPRHAVAPPCRAGAAWRHPPPPPAADPPTPRRPARALVRTDPRAGPAISRPAPIPAVASPASMMRCSRTPAPKWGRRRRCHEKSVAGGARPNRISCSLVGQGGARLACTPQWCNMRPVSSRFSGGRPVRCGARVRPARVRPGRVRQRGAARAGEAGAGADGQSQNGSSRWNFRHDRPIRKRAPAACAATKPRTTPPA